MKDKQMKFKTEQIEPMILGIIFKDGAFFRKFKEELKTTGKKSYFNEPKYQNVFNLYCNYFDKYKVHPSKDTLLSVVDMLEDEDEIKLYLSVIIKETYSYNLEELNIEFLEEEVIKIIKDQRLYEAILSYSIDKDIKPIIEADRIDFDSDYGLTVSDTNNIFSSIESLFDDDNCISSGYSSLDNSLSGGFFEKEITVIAGIAGSGKTLIMGNFAINAFKEGKKVLFCSMETSSERLWLRFISNILEKKTKDVIKDINKSKKEFEEECKNFTGDLRIKEYKTNEASSNDIASYMKELEIYQNWVPDIIFIDYILIMKSNDKKLSSDNSYKYFKVVTEELRNIAKEFCIPVVSASQLNRGAYGDKGGSNAIVSQKDMGESMGIIHTSDTVLMISQTARQKERGYIYMKLEKNRNGSNDIYMKFDVDYEHLKLSNDNIVLKPVF